MSKRKHKKTRKHNKGNTLKNYQQKKALERSYYKTRPIEPKKGKSAKQDKPQTNLKPNKKVSKKRRKQQVRRAKKLRAKQPNHYNPFNTPGVFDPRRGLNNREYLTSLKPFYPAGLGNYDKRNYERMVEFCKDVDHGGGQYLPIPRTPVYLKGFRRLSKSERDELANNLKDLGTIYWAHQWTFQDSPNGFHSSTGVDNKYGNARKDMDDRAVRKYITRYRTNLKQLLIYTRTMVMKLHELGGDWQAVYYDFHK